MHKNALFHVIFIEKLPSVGGFPPPDPQCLRRMRAPPPDPHQNPSPLRIFGYATA